MPVIELGTTVDIHVLFRNSLVVGDGLLFKSFTPISSYAFRLLCFSRSVV